MNVINKIEEQDFIEHVKNLRKNITTNELASLYGYTSIKFNKILEGYNIQYKRSYHKKTRWILKKEFSNKGLQVSETSTYTKSNGEILIFNTPPKWTKKGVLYIYYYLKDRGIKPITITPDKDKIERKIEQLSIL